MKTNRALPTLLPLAVATVVASSCADFDREDRIEDLRILGVRTEPAEILYHPFHALIPAADRPPFLPLPTTDLQVDVLAFDPRGGTISGDVTLCPEGAGVCNDFDFDELLLAEPEGTRQEVRDAFAKRNVDSFVDPGLGDEPAGRVPDLSFSYTMTPAVIDALIQDTVTPSGERIPLINFFPALHRFVVDLKNPLIPDGVDVNREVGFKRLSTGLDFGHPDLPPELREALGAALGIEICEEVIPREEFEEGPTECYEPRPPNTNPNLVGFDIDDDLEAIDEEGMRYAEEADLGLSSLVSVTAGSELHITPVFLPDDREQYQVVSFNIEAQELFLQNRFEDYAVTWYSTRGDVSGDLTSVQFNQRLGNTWTAPQEVEPGERDQIVVIVQDQRGGTTWATINVEYR